MVRDPVADGRVLVLLLLKAREELRDLVSVEEGERNFCGRMRLEQLLGDALGLRGLPAVQEDFSLLLG